MPYTLACDAVLCYDGPGCSADRTTMSCEKDESLQEVHLTDPEVVTVYTVGHSNHEAAAFVDLMHQHGIRLVVDVRSTPYSRYVPQANRENLARALEAVGIAYRWMGDSLGGKPQGEVGDYDEIQASPAFQLGVDRLLDLAAEGHTAIMCSEGDHRQCHRHKLITPVILVRGARVLHIQRDASLVDEKREPKQLSLF